MKQITLILTSALYLFFVSCNSKTVSKTFYDENSFNTTKEIKSFENKLFILGQHFIKEDTIEHTTSILCLDTSLNKLWDRHYGSVNSDERFESFSITKDGNIFIAGYNSNSKSALLLKINQKGQMIWRKEFNSVNAFYNVAVYNENYLIVAGRKQFSNTGLYRDSSFIQKMDLNANVIWTKSICLTLPAPNFLKLIDDKIIFCANTYFNNSYYPNGKLFCLNENGLTEWTYDLDVNSTAIDKGVNINNLKIDHNNGIYVLCQSFGKADMALIKFSSSGQKINTYRANIETLKNNANNEDEVFLYTGLDLVADDKAPVTIIIKESSRNVPYFTSIDVDRQNIDFIKIKDKVYTIANEGELSNHYSNWLIEKRNE